MAHLLRRADLCRRIRVARDLSGLRDPQFLPRLEYVLERAPQGPQPEWLATDEGMDHHTHDQAQLVARPAHLIELVDDHATELPGTRSPADDAGAVVDFLRIRDRQDPAVPGAQPYRLIIHAEVQHIAEARFLEQVRCALSLGDPGARPARGRLAAKLLDLPRDAP